MHKAQPPTQRLPNLSTELSTNTALHSNLFGSNTKYRGWSAGVATIDKIFHCSATHSPTRISSLRAPESDDAARSSTVRLGRLGAVGSRPRALLGRPGAPLDRRGGGVDLGAAAV